MKLSKALRETIILDWINALSRAQLVDLCAIGVEMKHDEHHHWKEVHVMPNALKAGLIKTVHGQPLDIVWMANPLKTDGVQELEEALKDMEKRLL